MPGTERLPEKKPVSTKKRLLRMYERLNRFFGDLHWWPGETPFEVAVGAILTQNTNWANVEKAIGRLKAEGGPGSTGPATAWTMKSWPI